jgi:hypothetical protein
MPFDPKQMKMIHNLADSPHDCLVCGGRACLSVTDRDVERVEEAGRLNLRCSKCGIKVVISA